MKTILTQEDADALDEAQIATVAGLFEGFMRESGLRFGYTILITDKNGIRTFGNMPPESQEELFAFVSGKLSGEGADAVREMPVIVPGTH